MWHQATAILEQLKKELKRNLNLNLKEIKTLDTNEVSG